LLPQERLAFLKPESMITITVPTHTFLRKFIQHRANSTDGIINVSTLNSYGIHLLKILQKKAQWEPRESLKDFQDHIEFRLAEFFYTREGFYTSKQNIIFFNQVIKSEFDHIYDMVTINIARVLPENKYAVFSANRNALKSANIAA
jgi:hypothetical protein